MLVRDQGIHSGMDSYDDLLATLVSLREQAGFTQKDVANVCDVVQGAVGNWESKRAKVPWDHAFRLLHHYDKALVVVDRGAAVAADAGAVLGEMEDDARAVAADIVRQLANLDEEALLDVLAVVERFARVSDKAEKRLA